MRDKNDVDPDGCCREKLEVEGGEAVFWLYCMKEESMFNKRGKTKKFLVTLAWNLLGKPGWPWGEVGWGEGGAAEERNEKKRKLGHET